MLHIEKVKTEEKYEQKNRDCLRHIYSHISVCYCIFIVQIQIKCI